MTSCMYLEEVKKKQYSKAMLQNIYKMINPIDFGSLIRFFYVSKFNYVH
jgi:hypothetical protein